MKKALVLAGLAAGLFAFTTPGTAEAGHRSCRSYGGFRGPSYGYGSGYGHRGFRSRSFYGPRYGDGFRGRGFRGRGFRRGFYGNPYRRDGFNVRTRGFYLGIGR